MADRKSFDTRVADIIALTILAGGAALALSMALRSRTDIGKRRRAGHSDSAEGEAVDIDHRPAATAEEIEIHQSAPA